MIGSLSAEKPIHHDDERPCASLPEWSLREWASPTLPWSAAAWPSPSPRPAPARLPTCSAQAWQARRRSGKTTYWIHRATPKAKGVEMLGNIRYEEVGEQGLRISEGDGARQCPLAGGGPHRAVTRSLLTDLVEP